MALELRYMDLKRLVVSLTSLLKLVHNNKAQP
ncbi:Uncharacterised protein [Vibrio cholerae]|nr:Uncharacterised protein [Vibrio cholerae]